MSDPERRDTTDMEEVKPSTDSYDSQPGYVLQNDGVAETAVPVATYSPPG
jgi:hypothetical protein